MPMRRHLVPPSLVDALQPPAELPKAVDGSSEQPELCDTEVTPNAVSIGRPKGTTLDRVDAPFVNEIVGLVLSGGASSLHAAAVAVVGDGERVYGTATPASKVKRLRDRAKISIAEKNGG